MRSVPAISFDYRPPRQLWLAAGLLVILGSGVLATVAWPWLLRMALVWGVACVWGRSWRQARRPPLQRLHWDADGYWTLQGPAGRVQPLHLQRWRCWGSMLVLELVSRQGERLGLWLLPGELPADMLRQLHVRLRYGLSAPAASRG